MEGRGLSSYKVAYGILAQDVGVAFERSEIRRKGRPYEEFS
ncbi:hypothetical protein [Enterocloster sp.]